jgi:hypothetical protein
MLLYALLIILDADNAHSLMGEAGQNPRGTVINKFFIYSIQ